jgi:hypothetical protein
MAEFFELSSDERLEALVQAANAFGRPPHLLEKDVWVVWSLRHLQNATQPLGIPEQRDRLFRSIVTDDSGRT